jgi:ketosteroid isomerase-like protein
MKKMKNIKIAALTRCFSLLLLAQTGLAQGKTELKILDTEQRRMEAMTRRDTAWLHRHLAEDLLYLHSNAMQETKQEHLAAIASGRLVYEKMIRESAQVRRWGRTAVTNGRVRVQGLLNGNAFEVSLAYTAVYRRQKGRWLLLRWQSTRLP